MNKTKPKQRTTFEELRKLIRKRRRQIAFDSYPKCLQEFLTRTGANPYEEGSEERIEYRDFTITAKENSANE